jgi:hypothetical protein
MRLLLFIFLLATGRQLAAQDYLKQSKAVDLSPLWSADSIKIEDGNEKIEFPEPLGYIGNDYHANPDVYIVTGKTRVKANVCPFYGTITVKKAQLFPYTGERLIDEPEPLHYKQGRITCDINFYGDSSQTSSGYIKGSMITDFYLDNENNIRYDALFSGSDVFRNNQCKAAWTSYKTGLSKKCNWGDFRIPESSDLDIGAGDFSVDDKYVRNGWRTYMEAWVIGSPGSPATQKAKKVEEAHWWE